MLALKIAANYHCYTQGHRFPDWSVGFELTNELAEKVITLSKDYTWEEFRIMTDSYSPQPLPSAIINMPVEIAGQRAEFIASTAITKRIEATVCNICIHLCSILRPKIGVMVPWGRLLHRLHHKLQIRYYIFQQNHGLEIPGCGLQSGTRESLPYSAQ